MESHNRKMKTLKIWAYSDYNKYIKESLFNDYINKSLPIIKSYTDFASDIDKKILDLKKQSDSKLADSKAKLIDINREYLDYIRECMVDLEEHKTTPSSIYLDYHNFNPYESPIILREYYEFDVSEYDIFKNTMYKLNEYIGKYSYNVYFNAGPNRYRNLDINYDGTKTLADLDIYINRAIEIGEASKVFAYFEFRTINEKNDNNIKDIKKLNESYSIDSLKKEDIEYLFVDFIDDGGEVRFEDNHKIIDIFSYTDEDVINNTSYITNNALKTFNTLKTFNAFVIRLTNIDKNINKESILFVNDFLINYGLNFDHIFSFINLKTIYTNNVDKFDFINSKSIDIVYRKNK